MYGIVSLLDETHDAAVRELWQEFRATLGVHGVHMTPIPHFSYHVAEGYNLDALDVSLNAFAQASQPFTVRTNGLGLFTGDHPVLFIPVRREVALIDLHQRLWEQIDQPHLAQTPRTYYQPREWIPHITLAETDLTHETLPDFVRLLSQRDFRWEITVDNLAIIGGGTEANQVHGLIRRYDFGIHP